MLRATAVENVEVYESPGSYGRAQHTVADDMLIIGVPAAIRATLGVSGEWDDKNSTAIVELGAKSIKVKVVCTSESLARGEPFAAANTDCHCWMTPHVRQTLGVTRVDAPERERFEKFSAKFSAVTISVNALLFSYGSNGRKQLRGRIGRPVDVAFQTIPASLAGYRRIFCGNSPIWGGGGVASLHPFDGGTTYGNVVELTHKEFLIMDGFEGRYRRHIVTVNLLSGESLQAWAYIATNTAFMEPPTLAYLTAIHIMLREHWECDSRIDLLRVGEDASIQASSSFVCFSLSQFLYLRGCRTWLMHLGGTLS
jgi:hypothetical protein